MIRFVRLDAFIRTCTLAAAVLTGMGVGAAGVARADPPATARAKAHALSSPYAGYAGGRSALKLKHTTTLERSSPALRLKHRPLRRTSHNYVNARRTADQLARRGRSATGVYRSRRTVVRDRTVYVRPAPRHAYVAHRRRGANLRDGRPDNLWNHVDDADVYGSYHAARGGIGRLDTGGSRYRLTSPTSDLYARHLAEDLAHRRVGREGRGHRLAHRDRSRSGVRVHLGYHRRYRPLGYDNYCPPGYYHHRPFFSGHRFHHRWWRGAPLHGRYHRYGYHRRLGWRYPGVLEYGHDGGLFGGSSFGFYRYGPGCWDTFHSGLSLDFSF